MSEKRIIGRAVQKHDIEANWLKATNFTPMQGEVIVYDIDENYDYERIKIGDGVHNVNDLLFYAGSWEDLADRPFWSEGPTIVEWDGNTDGLTVSSDGTAYRVSDLKPSSTEVIGGKLTFSNGSVVEITPDIVEGTSYIISIYYGTVYINTTNGSAYNASIGVTLSEPGIYFQKNTYNQIVSFSYGNETVYTLDEKFIPDTIARTSDIPEQITVDSELSSTSTNPVQNKVVNGAINNLTTLIGDTSVSNQISNAIAEIPEQVQADWNENDETSLAYVANRTHWIDATKAIITFDASNGTTYINDGNSTVEIAFSNDRMVSTAAGSYYRVLDDALTNDQFKSLVIRSANGDFVVADYWDTFVAEGFITDGYGFAELVLNVVSDNTTTTVGAVSTKGLYLSTNILDDKFIDVNYTVEEIVHTLDQKYIPDNVNNLVITITQTNTDTYSADKTAEEIIAAFESGIKCYVMCYDSIGLISSAGKDMRGNTIIFSMIHTSANSTSAVFYSSNKWNVRDVTYLTTDGASISGTLSVNSGNLVINADNGKSGMVFYDGESFQIGSSKNAILLSSTEDSTKYFKVAVDDNKNIIVTNVNDTTDTLTIAQQVIDTTLANSGQAADAKATGDAIGALNALVGDTSVAEQISEATYTQTQVDELIAAVKQFCLPKIRSITLTESNWVFSANYYYQDVPVGACTPTSKVDLQPTYSQLATWQDDGLAFTTQSRDGIVRVWAIPEAPREDITVQISVQEVLGV